MNTQSFVSQTFGSHSLLNVITLRILNSNTIIEGYLDKSLALQDCLKCYEIYAEKHLVEHLHLLKGKNLSCLCEPDQPCHVDILIKLYKKYHETEIQH